MIGLESSAQAESGSPVSVFFLLVFLLSQLVDKLSAWHISYPEPLMQWFPDGPVLKAYSMLLKLQVLESFL